METLTNGLNVEVTETAPCCYTLKLAVPAEYGKKIYSDVLTSYLKNVRIPGFRAGRVPTKMVKKSYGEEIISQATSKILQNALDTYIAEKKCDMSRPFEPVGDLPLYVEDAAYECTVSFEAYSDFALPEYKGLKVTAKAEAISDEQVDNAVDSLIHTRGKYEVVERAAEAGDMVKTTYTSDADDAAKEDKRAGYLLSGNNSWQILRDPELIPGITKALAGLKAGESRDVEIEFPADFRIDTLQGKKIMFHFTINEVHGYTAPEMTPELFKELGAEDMDGLKKKMRSDMENRADMVKRSAAMDELYKQLVEKLDFPLPPTELENNVRSAVERRIEAEKQGGKATEEEVAAKVPQFEEEAREQAAKDMRFAKFLIRVAAAENLEVTQQDLGNFFMQYAMQNNTDPQELINMCLKNQGTMYRINQDLLSRKALNLICDSSVAADA